MKPKSPLPAIIGTFGIVLLIFIFIIAINAFFTVQYGTIGVITRFGALTDQVVQPGAHFKIPLVEDVLTYNTQKITYETSDTPGDSEANYTDFSVDTTTFDGQQVSVRYTVRFAIDPAQVVWIASNIGQEKDVVEKIVKSESRIHVRNIVREYEAEQLYTGDIQNTQLEIKETLEEIFKNNGIILDSFGIRQIQFQPEYLAAIEQKQIEKEKVTAEQFKAEQEKFIAEQVITRAQGEAEAQRLQQLTLSDLLVQKMWIERWDGQVPTYTGDGGNLFFGLPR
jgi:regulator of protease activity HflC (stomatin/prohibitin superfamily)